MRLKRTALMFLVLLLAIGTSTSQASEGLPFWGAPVKLEGMSADRVSAVWYNGELHIAHGGKNSDAIWHAWWDGRQWMTNRVSNLQGRGTPALAVYQNTLHMVYKGEDNTLWQATSQGRNWTPRGKIPGQTSHYSPSLVFYPYDPITGQRSERLWLFHGGGSKETKRDGWDSFFNGSAWSDDQKRPGVSESTVGLCLHNDRLYQSTVYATGVNIIEFVKSVGWRPMETVPQGAKSTTPVALVSDGHNLYAFYRFSRSAPGKQEPIYASVFTGTKWETPFPVKDFVSSESPAVVAVPGQKAQFHLLFTRNQDIYFTSTATLKPLKPMIQKAK